MFWKILIFLKILKKYCGLFGSMTMIAFQNAFHLEVYQNNIFFIFKKIFLKSVHQNNIKILKKILI